MISHQGSQQVVLCDLKTRKFSHSPLRLASELGSEMEGSREVLKEAVKEERSGGQKAGRKVRLMGERSEWRTECGKWLEK